MSLSDLYKRLPEMAAASVPHAGDVVVKRGIEGYWPLPEGFTVESFNSLYSVTPQQREAMVVGSMFGFHVPAADPDMYKVLDDGRCIPDMNKVRKVCNG